MTIKVFSPDADDIHEGDIYIASIESVEGRTVVTLKPKMDGIAVENTQALIRKDLLL